MRRAPTGFQIRLIDSMFLRREFCCVFVCAESVSRCAEQGTLKRIVSLSRMPLAPTTRWVHRAGLFCNPHNVTQFFTFVMSGDFPATKCGDENSINHKRM